MADQTVRVENLPDSGSAEAVALSLWRHLRNNHAPVDEQLKLYTRCITAVRSVDPSYHHLFG